MRTRLGRSTARATSFPHAPRDQVRVSRVPRLLGAVAVVLAVGSVGAAAGTGSAVAAGPVVVGSCSTSVQGAPGQPVSLSPSAVVEPVATVINRIPLLGPPLVAPFRQAFNALPPIPLGAFPNGTATVSGADIAAKVNTELAKLPLLGTVINTVTPGVQQSLTKLCGVTLQGVNAAAGQVQQGSQALSQAAGQALGQVPGGNGGQPAPHKPPAGQPGTQSNTGSPQGASQGQAGQQSGGQTGFTPVGGLSPAEVLLYPFGKIGENFGRVPMFSYGSLPFALPGGFSPSPGVRYGSQAPGLGGTGFRPSGAGQSEAVQTAGQAQALPNSHGVGGVGAPILLAVLALSCVTGALVRTWVLRRSVV
jgi:hypothetical protein